MTIHKIDFSKYNGKRVKITCIKGSFNDQQGHATYMISKHRLSLVADSGRNFSFDIHNVVGTETFTTEFGEYSINIIT